MQNNTDNLPQSYMDAENAENRKQARNVLAAIQFHQSRKDLRAKAVRAQYIQPNEITG